MRALSFACALALAGCSGTPAPTGSLVKPAARCRAAPEPIPRPLLGEPSKAYTGRVIEYAIAEVSKEVCLQRWAQEVTR